MPTLLEQRDSLVKEARNIAERAKSEARALTTAELNHINENVAKAKSLDDQERAAAVSDSVFRELMSIGSDGKHNAQPSEKSATLGEHFVKHAAAQLLSFKNRPGASIAVPEWKAAGDTQLTGDGPYGPALTTIDTSVTRGYRRQPVVADLCGSGTLSGQSITYFVEGAREGGFTTVAEGGKKPQLHYLYSTVTESISKIAGFIKLSDEMIDDLAFLVSEINSRLLYDLAIFEEAQILNGDGTAPNLRGILQRSGIQTEAGTGAGDNLDAIFRAATKVQTATGMAADGVVIHPDDYQVFRLMKDGNQQYYGGGPFTGAYGNGGGVPIEPSVWGLPTVVTAAIAAKTVLVGNFRQASTVYRKGGVTVSSTNSNVDDFENNIVTVRAEERLGLAVRVPAAFVKITLT